MKMTGLLILAVLGVASAGLIGGRPGLSSEDHGDPIIPGPRLTDPTTIVDTRRYRVNGIVTFDRHACVFRNGEVFITGPVLTIGENAPVEVESGFATTTDGERVLINDGLVHVNLLSNNDIQALLRVLSRAGITYYQFIQYTQTTPPQQGILEVTAGVININGVYRNIRAGLLIAVDISDHIDIIVPIPDAQPRFEAPVSSPVPTQSRVSDPSPSSGYGVPGPNPVPEPEDKTIYVTKTMAHETVTITQPALLSRTNTNDVYVTVTAPFYVSHHVTFTKIFQQTETVPEEQVIRSSLPGTVIVNMVPQTSEIVLTVTNTATQFSVSTEVNTLTSTLQHTEKLFNFKTITVLNPQTTTVVKTITQTGVTTAYITSTVDSTVYVTSTMVMTITAEPPTTTYGGYY